MTRAKGMKMKKILAEIEALERKAFHNMSRAKLEGYKPLLKQIDKAIDALDRYDREGGYGDMAQNFEDVDRERHTHRLYKMIEQDLRKV